MDEVFQQLKMPASLASDFFAVFSRFEYALKSTGYVTGNSRYVNPNWDKYAIEIDDKLLKNEDENLKKAIDYILDDPPRKQILYEKEVIFKKQITDHKQCKTQQLLLMIRTVRNNLFHGGKYLPDGEAEEKRNEILVNHSITILKEAIQINKKVYSSYEK